MPFNTSPTLDLPPELQELMNMQSMGHPASQQQAAPAPNPTMPNYADGGMVGPGGQPMTPGMPMQGGPQLGAQPQQDDYNLGVADVEGFMQANPQAVQQIAAELQADIQSGEISMQQLQMGEKLATAALNDPETYPQIRQFAVQQGLVEDEDMPMEFDEGALFAIVLAARAVLSQSGEAQQPAPSPMNMKDGGIVTPGTNGSSGGTVAGPGTGTSDSVPINVSAGEYVIPAHVVQMKGREFFDKMLENYKPGGKDK